MQNNWVYPNQDSFKNNTYLKIAKVLLSNLIWTCGFLCSANSITSLVTSSFPVSGHWEDRAIPERIKKNVKNNKIKSFPSLIWKIKIHNKMFHLLNTSYLTDSYIVFTLKMKSVSKTTIFGLKMMVKSGLKKFSNKHNHLSAWRDFKKNLSRPLLTIIFRPKILYFWIQISFWG